MKLYWLHLRHGSACENCLFGMCSVGNIPLGHGGSENLQLWWCLVKLLYMMITSDEMLKLEHFGYRNSSIHFENQLI